MKAVLLPPGIVIALISFSNLALALNQEHLRQLEQTGSCPSCDLSGADLRGRNLSGADLTGANLVQAKLEGTNLRGANLRNARGASWWDGIVDATTILPNGSRPGSEPVPPRPNNPNDRQIPNTFENPRS